MGTGAAHGVKMARSQRLPSGLSPSGMGRGSERERREVNVNKHVFIEQKYVQHPLCSSLS